MMGKETALKRDIGSVTRGMHKGEGTNATGEAHECCPRIEPEILTFGVRDRITLALTLTPVA